MKSYWDSLADQFQYQQPPLRPCAEDIRILQKIVHAPSRQQGLKKINVLLFGVTPEIVKLNWPANTFLTAVEKSQAMINTVWPGNIPDQRQVIQDDWFKMEIENQSLDFIIGDGFLTPQPYPQRYGEIAGKISDWLKPGGLFVARLFARSQQQETLAEIRADLQANRIAKFDILKWRLAMALQPDTQTGVIVDEVYRAWKNIENEFPALPEQAGWPRLTVNTINLYAGRTDRYAFPTIAELHQAFSPWLESVSVTIPDYDFGQCCPILIYRRSAVKAEDSAF